MILISMRIISENLK